MTINKDKIVVKPLKSALIKKKAKTAKRVTAQRSKEEISLKAKAFSELFTDSDKDFFGNGVQSYIYVYKPDTSKPSWYKTACVSASQLLSNVKVCEYINKLLDKQGYNDENVKKQHLFLINQFSDLGVKIRSVQEYNKVSGKYLEDKLHDTAREQILEEISERRRLRKEKYGNKARGISGGN